MLKLVQLLVELDPPRSDGAEFIVEAAVDVDFIATAFPCPDKFRPHDGPWMKLIFKEGGDVTVRGRPRDLLEQPPAKEEPKSKPAMPAIAHRLDQLGLFYTIDQTFGGVYHLDRLVDVIFDGYPISLSVGTYDKPVVGHPFMVRAIVDGTWQVLEEVTLAHASDLPILLRRLTQDVESAKKGAQP